MESKVKLLAKELSMINSQRRERILSYMDPDLRSKLRQEIQNLFSDNNNALPGKVPNCS